MIVFQYVSLKSYWKITLLYKMIFNIIAQIAQSRTIKFQENLEMKESGI